MVPAEHIHKRAGSDNVTPSPRCGTKWDVGNWYERNGRCGSRSPGSYQPRMPDETEEAISAPCRGVAARAPSQPSPRHRPFRGEADAAVLLVTAARLEPRCVLDQGRASARQPWDVCPAAAGEGPDVDIDIISAGAAERWRDTPAEGAVPHGEHGRGRTATLKPLARCWLAAAWALSGPGWTGTDRPFLSRRRLGLSGECGLCVFFLRPGRVLGDKRTV